MAATTITASRTSRTRPTCRSGSRSPEAAAPPRPPLRRCALTILGALLLAGCAGLLESAGAAGPGTAPAAAAGAASRQQVVAAAPAAPADLRQNPAARWRTLATPHYRVHYPEPYAAWARRAAAWLEAVRDRTGAEIGFTPEGVVDVVVSDPEADANGEALPLRGWPRLVLWTT